MSQPRARSALDSASIDPAVVEREKAVLADKNAGKPAHILEKIVESGLKILLQGGQPPRSELHPRWSEDRRPGRQGSREDRRCPGHAQGIRALRAWRGDREARRAGFRRRSRQHVGQAPEGACSRRRTISKGGTTCRPSHVGIAGGSRRCGIFRRVGIPGGRRSLSKQAWWSGACVDVRPSGP